MAGRFLSPVDIASAKRESEIHNSLKKRGVVTDLDDIEREFHVVCGCGAPGCIFISYQRTSKDRNFKMNEAIVKQLADHANAAQVYFDKDGHYSVVTPEINELVRLTVLSCIDEVRNQTHGEDEKWDAAVTAAIRALHKKFSV